MVEAQNFRVVTETLNFHESIISVRVLAADSSRIAAVSLDFGWNNRIPAEIRGFQGNLRSIHVVRCHSLKWVPKIVYGRLINTR